LIVYIASTINHAKTQERCDAPFAFSKRQPRIGTSVSLVMHHTYVCASLYQVRAEDSVRVTCHILSANLLYQIKFARLFGWTRNNSKCFSLSNKIVRTYPNVVQRYE